MIVWLATPREVWPASFGSTLAGSTLALAPIAIRRRWLWAAVALTAAVNVIAPLLGTSTGPEGLGLVVVAYTVAAWLPLRGALLGTLALWVPPLLVVVAKPDLDPELARVGPLYVITVNALLGLLVFFIGRTVHTRRRYISALEQRADAAESNQRALAARAVADERQRIARELHDVVAHHVSVMGVLATGARRSLRRDPDSADAALAAIQETGRTAMRELRRLLDVLRTEGDPAELTPQPGLAGVATLVEQIREAGLAVSYQAQGESNGLDPGVALTAYRIVQEALTNTIKHAGPATAEVRLAHRGDHVVVEVLDNGRGPSAVVSGVGHGLVGMRERVALYHGELRTGPRPGGGFQVYAKVPVDRLDRADDPGEPVPVQEGRR
ncbi:MAG: sensor histidine kinase [Micromonosporaceae bacterium]|nr:sensor histidine kinase [Micromonosporaceae bacterium]